jgi:hypothetical protein
VASAPSWLQDEPEIQALLGTVLDMFDGKSSEERTRAIFLPAQKHLASLARMDEAADHTWSLLRDLARTGVLSIRTGKRSDLDPEWHNAKIAFAPESESALREWLGRPAVPSKMVRWREAVQEHAHLYVSGLDLLMSRRIAVSGRTDSQVVAALARLAHVRRPATLRQLSTLAFWGDSKVLDDRGDLIAALFPGLPVRERPIVVAVNIPERVEGALFIENQDNYSAAFDGELPAGRALASIYLAGFRGTAARIRSRQGVRLHFAGPGIEQRERFEGWWFDGEPFVQQCYFWGDLDFAGMQMLKSLRQRFGDVRAWKPGYEPMLAALRAAGEGAQPLEGRAGQVDPEITGCDFADHVLLPAVRERGFWDQESMVE